MKVKSKKIVTKRFKITGTGKVKHRVGQWNHLRLKKGVKVHGRKHGARILASNKQAQIIKSYMTK